MVWRVALGPKESWVAWDDESTDIGWSRKCPGWIQNFLRGRFSGTGMRAKSSPLRLFAFDENRFAAVFQDGTTDRMGDLDFRNAFDACDPPKVVAIGGDSTYLFVGSNGEMKWVLHRGKDSAGDLVTWKGTPVLVALGKDDRYYMEFQDGTTYWKGIDWKGIDGPKDETPTFFALSPDDAGYFTAYPTRKAWNVSQEFNNFFLSDQYLSPFEIYYTNKSCARSFVCGRSMQGVVDDLHANKITEDDIPCMQVFQYANKWFSKDNRRLWVFRQAAFSSVPVQVVATPPTGFENKLADASWDTDQIKLRGPDEATYNSNTSDEDSTMRY